MLYHWFVGLTVASFGSTQSTKRRFQPSVPRPVINCRFPISKDGFCISSNHCRYGLVTVCSDQYGDDGEVTSADACVCTGVRSFDATDCASCLSPTIPSLGEFVTMLPKRCEVIEASKMVCRDSHWLDANHQTACAYECNYQTCDPADISCQCSVGYLQQVLKYVHWYPRSVLSLTASPSD